MKVGVIFNFHKMWKCTTQLLAYFLALGTKIGTLNSHVEYFRNKTSLFLFSLFILLSKPHDPSLSKFTFFFKPFFPLQLVFNCIIPVVKGIRSSALVSSFDEEFLANRELLGIKWLYCGTNYVFLSIYLIVFHAFVLAGPSVRMRGDSTLFKTLSPRPDASLAKAAFII